MIYFFLLIIGPNYVCLVWIWVFLHHNLTFPFPFFLSFFQDVRCTGRFCCQLVAIASKWTFESIVIDSRWSTCGFISYLFAHETEMLRWWCVITIELQLFATVLPEFLSCMSQPKLSIRLQYCAMIGQLLDWCWKSVIFCSSIFLNSMFASHQASEISYYFSCCWLKP